MENKAIRNIEIIINTLRKLPPALQVFLHHLNETAVGEKTAFHYTVYAGHATQLAYAACENKADLIIAVGGDGTFHEVVNGMLHYDAGLPALALIPNGTGNDFCRSQHIVFSVQRLLAALQAPVYRWVDAGKIELKTGVRYFLNIADLGFGGHTASILNMQRKKGLHGGISYSLAIIRAFGSYRMPEVFITADGHDLYRGKLMMLAICNGSTFGNGLIIQPDARTDDGKFHLALLGKVSFADYILNLITLKKGNKIKHKNVHYSEARMVKVHVIKKGAITEADGEIAGEGDIEVVIMPSAIPLLVY